MTKTFFKKIINCTNNFIKFLYFIFYNTLFYFIENIKKLFYILFYRKHKKIINCANNFIL